MEAAVTVCSLNQVISRDWWTLRCPVCVGILPGEASWLLPELPACPQVPVVMKALQRQLKDRNVRTRQGCFNLLTELAGVLPGSLAEHMPALVSGRLGYSWLSTFGPLPEYRPPTLY